MSSVPMAFVAYPSNDRSLASMILDGVRRANAKSSSVRYEPWEFNDIAGQPLVSPIFERIQESTFVVADITYLNLNVVYEVGFAIGSKKRAFLIRHKDTKGDADIAKQTGIFDTLGYDAYDNVDGLCHRLANHIETAPLNFGNSTDFKSPIYVVEPPEKGDAATIMISRLKKAKYRYRSFNPSEDSRLSAVDAIRQVAASAGVMVSIYNPAIAWAHVHNVRALFVAGLADGMGKPSLILSSGGFDIPLDVRDDARVFQRSDDIAEYISEFVPEVANYLQQLEPVPARAGTSLQTLRMGDPTAENEMTTLANYYLPTNEYGLALQGDVNLVVGRKGSGKTALFIQVRDRVRNDKRNIVVDLKPEGYQLLKLKEDILVYLSEGTRQHLITAFWEYLILLEIAYKLLEKDRATHKYNHEIYDLYRELEATYRGGSVSNEGDFSERLLTLSQRLSSEFKAKHGDATGQRLTTNQIAELLYLHDIRALESKISTYLEKKQSVWVLFDNLDKGWSTGGIDALDAISLRCLIDAGRKIERDMRKASHEVHCMVFIRNDVYEHVMRKSADYGKEMRAVLDWADPDLLREMLRLRLISGLGVDGSLTFQQVWRQVCASHCMGEESSAFMIDRCLMRPRNLLKLFNYSRGFANNFSRTVIADEDIQKGWRVYSLDLLEELSHELVDVFPGADDLLYYFMDAKQSMLLEELDVLLEKAGVDEGDREHVVDFLFYYGVIGLRLAGGDQYIFNVNYDPKVLQIRALMSGGTAHYVINPAFWPSLGIS